MGDREDWKSQWNKLVMRPMQDRPLYSGPCLRGVLCSTSIAFNSVHLGVPRWHFSCSKDVPSSLRNACACEELGVFRLLTKTERFTITGNLHMETVEIKSRASKSDVSYCLDRHFDQFHYCIFTIRPASHSSQHQLDLLAISWQHNTVHQHPSLKSMRRSYPTIISSRTEGYHTSLKLSVVPMELVQSDHQVPLWVDISLTLFSVLPALKREHEYSVPVQMVCSVRTKKCLKHTSYVYNQVVWDGKVRSYHEYDSKQL